MINFDFYTPTRVLFGADRENEAGKQVAAFGGHKVMIIYGKKGGHVESSGLLERVHQSLNGAGLSYIDFSGVVPNPRLSLVKEGIRIGRSEGVDFLLPIGGGSVIDTAKHHLSPQAPFQIFFLYRWYFPYYHISLYNFYKNEKK